MDDTEDGARYRPISYHQNHHPSTHRPKFPVRNSPYNQPEYDEDDEEEEQVDVEEEEEEEEEEEDEEEENGVQKPVEDEDENGVDEDGGNYDEDDDEEEDDDDRVRENDVVRANDGVKVKDEYKQMVTTSKNTGIHVKEEEDDLERQRKKRKFKNLGYEFAPRAAAAAAAAPPPPAPPVAAANSFPRPAFIVGGRNSPADWSENSTFVLLDAWGDRFVQLGRKSLRSDEWQDVAKTVSHTCRTLRTDTQCRNRLDTLKKKYKKEKARMAETGETDSTWVYFKKMDELLSASVSKPGLTCGLDSGEYVFMNPRDYLKRSNGLDEMRDSPGNSESTEHDEDDSDGLPPPKRRMSVESKRRGVSSFRLLADSIHKFGEIYEKIENNKRQQMVELEKMRMEFHRDLEMQKRKIMERAHAEIAKIRQGDDEDVSTENTSG